MESEYSAIINHGLGYDADTRGVYFSEKFDALDNKLDRMGCNAAEAKCELKGAIHAAQDAATGAVGTEGRALQMQLADATCKLSHEMHEEGEATRNLIRDTEIQRLRDKVASLEADKRMCGVVRFPTEMVYSSNNSPFCNYNRCHE